MREDAFVFFLFTFDISVDNAMLMKVSQRLEDFPSDYRYALFVYPRQGLELEYTQT